MRAADPKEEILQTISLLFELSLSIGGTLEVEACMMNFVKKIMAAMNLSQFGMWLDLECEENQGLLETLVPTAKLKNVPQTGFVQAFAHPFRNAEDPSVFLHPSTEFTQAISTGGLSRMVTNLPDGFTPVNGSATGACALIPLGSLNGFIALHSIARSEPFPLTRLNQMRPLIDKFGTSLAGAVAYQRATLEIAQRRIAEQEAVNASAAKSFFISNMNHEIRSPLNEVMGFAQILAESDLDEENRALAKELMNHADDLTTKFTRLMSLAHQSDELDRVMAKVFSPAELIESICATYQPRIPESIRFVIEVGRLPSLVECDPGKWSFLFDHALENALKFTEQGTIEMQVAWEEKEWIDCCVRDSGVGLDPRSRDRAFNLLETLGRGRHTHQGAGVGLTISKRMIEALGGSIELDGEEGKGAILRWRIPCRQVGLDDLDDLE